MHQPRPSKIDERIHDFLARKTPRRNLSQTITDWLADSRRAKTPARRSRYETLPWVTN